MRVVETGILLPASPEMVYGIDLSESGIGVASKRACGTFAVASMYDDLRILFQGIDYFDAIIAIDTIEHLYSPRIFARRSFEALRPGGILIVTVPYWGYLKNILLALTNRLDGALTALWDGGHIKHWSRKTLTELMIEQSYEVVSFEGCGRPIPYLWNSMMMVFRKPKLLPINSNGKGAG
jgi:2-polyprenyl-3-methyl-5-hydroxy-6-metoxy-1,4-benzoquinol methylase